MNASQNNPQSDGQQDDGNAIRYERRILDALPTGTLITRISDGTILFANQAIGQLLGIPEAATVLGQPVPNFYWDPAERQVLLGRFRAEGSLKNYELRVRRADESMFWASISLSLFNFEGETALLSTIVDITERKQAEQTVRDSEQRFRTVADFTHSWEYWLGPDGRFLYVSPACERISGYAAEEFERDPKLLSKIIHPDDHAAWDEHIRVHHTERNEQSAELDMRILTREGETRWIGHVCQAVHDNDGIWQGRRASNRDITELKRAEQTLRDTDVIYSAVVTQANDGVVIIQDNVLQFTNKSMGDMLGYALPEMENTPFVNYVVSENKPLVINRIKAHLAGENVPPRYEIGLKHKDGTTVFTELSAGVKEYRGKPAYVAMIRDISKRKQTEEALRESEQRFRQFIEATTDGLVFHEQDQIVIANPAAFRMFGLSEDSALLGKNLLEFIASESREIVLKQMSIKSEMPYDAKYIPTYDDASSIVIESVEDKDYHEILCIRKDGSTFPAEISTYTYRIGDHTIHATSLRDITERLQAEQTIRDNEQLFRTIANFTYDWEYWLTPDGKFTYVSPSCERISGYSPEEFENDPNLFAKLITPEDHEAWEEHIRAYHGAHNFEIGELNFRITTHAGDQRWIAHVCQVVHDKQGVWQGRRASNRDITERKRLESEVQATFERRGFQVQISTEISQEIASASELSDLFARVVTLTKERLGYYHTQILRYDPAQDAVVLISGYGETGQKMLAGGHKLPMGSGLIGTAASSGQTILRPALAEDPDWQPNPLLPDTQGEIAVPIKLGAQVLGVLDVQSDQAGALTDDDRLLLEGLCGQIAVAIEQTRLRQEMAERLEEVNRLYQSMSHEGWKTYRATADLPAGFMFDQAVTSQVHDEDVLTDELFANIPMKVLGGEVVGTLTVANDPLHPTSAEDRAFLQQVSEQIALALESARLTAQTQSALAQSENLFAASRELTQAADLQELVTSIVKTLNVPVVNRAMLGSVNYSSADEVQNVTVIANWWNGNGHKPFPIGTLFTLETLHVLSFFLSPSPVFINDSFNDERVDASTLEVAKQQNTRAATALPLHLGTRQIGILLLEAESPHNFTQDEIRLFSALAPQIATVLENRRQYERAQKQAEREGMLNIISQKIQGATTVEAVLQIAARELGHALGAPMTIAQLGMKDKK